LTFFLPFFFLCPSDRPKPSFYASTIPDGTIVFAPPQMQVQIVADGSAPSLRPFSASLRPLARFGNAEFSSPDVGGPSFFLPPWFRSCRPSHPQPFTGLCPLSDLHRLHLLRAFFVPARFLSLAPDFLDLNLARSARLDVFLVPRACPQVLNSSRG